MGLWGKAVYKLSEAESPRGMEKIPRKFQTVDNGYPSFVCHSLWVGFSYVVIDGS